MFSYFKNKKANKRRSECIEDVKTFIQVHFVRERAGERYKYNTLTLKTDPEREACDEWYEQHDNPSRFGDIVKLYMSDKSIGIDSITSQYKLAGTILSDDDIAKGDAVAICLGLRLNFAETKRLLKSAGHALTNSYEADLIVRYCIENQIYDFEDVEFYLSSLYETCLKDLI